MPYIISTLSNSQRYNTYKKAENDQFIVDKQILIQGRANIPNKHLLTPNGVVTQVSDAELEQLRANEVFVMHEKNGFIQVQNNKPDVDKAVQSGMVKKDQSAPKAEEDFEAKATTSKKTSKK